MYLEQIKQLVALQHVDSEIITLNAELEAAPKEVEALEADYARIQERRQGILDKLAQLKEQDERLAGEIDDDGMRIKKSKNKLMMASNTKEYHAMMREMDNMEKLNRLREEEKVTISEELARQNEDLAAIDAEAGTISSELEEKRASLAERIKAAEDRLAALGSRRKASGNSVPPPVLGRYEFIRSRLKAPVIVPVGEGICTGCNIRIPPQAFIELQKGSQILSCPNCQRLIYWCEHFTDEEGACASDMPTGKNVTPMPPPKQIVVESHD